MNLPCLSFIFRQLTRRKSERSVPLLTYGGEYATDFDSVQHLFSAPVDAQPAWFYFCDELHAHKRLHVFRASAALACPPLACKAMAVVCHPCADWIGDLGVAYRVHFSVAAFCHLHDLSMM